ncbi:uncharacterized protein VNE69_01073 [Vairimorpha necatrix]|uniref:Uncharacterized protein n=1 Tax=Vairimorpha necatrix TaxID=6039 RepID=A0AAX4J805_9MICR
MEILYFFYIHCVYSITDKDETSGEITEEIEVFENIKDVETTNEVTLRQHNRKDAKEILNIVDREEFRIKLSHLNQAIYKRYLISQLLIADKEYNETECESKIFNIVYLFARLHFKVLHRKDPKISNSIIATKNFKKDDYDYHEYKIYWWYMRKFNIKKIYLGETISKPELGLPPEYNYKTVSKSNKIDFLVYKLRLEDLNVLDKYYIEEQEKKTLIDDPQK